MRPTFFLPGCVLAFGLAGCNTRTQDAVVVSKEFIPAQIMAGDAPAPGQNERAIHHDQWLVHIETADRMKARADVEQAQWLALRVGDKVEATYSKGKYTGTVWSVSLRKK